MTGGSPSADRSRLSRTTIVAFIAAVVAVVVHPQEVVEAAAIPAPAGMKRTSMAVIAESASIWKRAGMERNGFLSGCARPGRPPHEQPDVTVRSTQAENRRMGVTGAPVFQLGVSA